MSSTIKVVVFPASGHIGRAIVDGLLDSPTNFEITAITRPASLDKPVNVAYREKGIKVVGAEMTDPREKLVEILRGADTVITPAHFTQIDQQKNIIDLCKELGVKRYIPSNFGPVMPPTAMDMRVKKEEIISYIKLQHVPYTIVDMGFWYEGIILKIPSGRNEHAMFPGPRDYRIKGTGDVPTSYARAASVGPAVAKIIADPRTLNKYVHVYEDVVTQHQAIDVLEELSGEKVDKVYYPKEEIEASLAVARDTLKQNPEDLNSMIMLTMGQYYYSLLVRGDTTPEMASYLGYLDIYELYPELKEKIFTLRDFYKGVLDGTVVGEFETGS